MHLFVTNTDMKSHNTLPLPLPLPLPVGRTANAAQR